MTMHTLAVAALVSTMIAPSPVIAHHDAKMPQIQQHTVRARLSTDQMYRDFMQSGSIYYGDHRAGPPAHMVKRANPSMRGIEQEARRFAFSSDPYIPPTVTARR